MKLLETISEQEVLTALENSDGFGVFKYLQNLNIFIDSNKTELSNGYYYGHSGNKTISPLYERLMGIAKKTENTGQPQNAEELLSKIIISKFGYKWSVDYNILLSQEYDALDEKSYTETKSANNTRTTTYGKILDQTVGDTGTITKEYSGTDLTKIGTHEKTMRNTENIDDVYGYNSSTPVGDSYSNDNSFELVEGDAEKNTEDISRTSTNTDTRNLETKKKDTYSGSDEDADVINESFSKTGRDTAPSDLLIKELSFRAKHNMFDIIFKDIDSLATLNIYI